MEDLLNLYCADPAVFVRVCVSVCASVFGSLLGECNASLKERSRKRVEFDPVRPWVCTCLWPVNAEKGDLVEEKGNHPVKGLQKEGPRKV